MQEVPDGIDKEEEPLHVLKKIFGHDSFREGQEEAIQNITEGKDCVILMPTGDGKSLIFTIAAILKHGVILEALCWLSCTMVESLKNGRIT